MEVKQFITRPDIMSIYNKEGMTEEVLASITEVAGYQIAKEKMNEESKEEEPIEEPTEEPTETPTEEPTETPSETPTETPGVEEPVEEPEIVVEETEE